MNRKDITGMLATLLIGLILGFILGINIGTYIDEKVNEQTSIEPTNFKAGELLPCPCCGGVGELHNNTINEREYYVECNGCGLHTDYYKGATEYDAKMVATRAWNMRCGSWKIIAYDKI